MAQVMAVMAIASVVSSIAGGMEKAAAAKKEAVSLDNQAALSDQEAQIEAQIHATQVRKFAANQKSAFLKNGVTLEGSPLLVLEDTRSAGQDEVNAMIRSGAARSQLLRDKADQARSEGRSSLISGFGNAASTGASKGMSAYGSGLFGSNTPSTPADTGVGGHE